MNHRSNVEPSQADLFQKFLGIRLIDAVIPLANAVFCIFAITTEWTLDDSIQRLFFMNIGLILLTPIFFKDQAMLFVYGTAVFPVLVLFMAITTPDVLQRGAGAVLLGGLNLAMIVFFAMFSKDNRFTDGLILSLVPSFILGLFTIGLFHHI